MGEVDRLDERCDVFGMGAMLSEILTRQPPYLGKDFTQLYRKAMRADLTEAFAQFDGCGVDAELIALAEQCLAAEPEDRQRDAVGLEELRESLPKCNISR
jgi:hypothetical protein